MTGLVSAPQPSDSDPIDGNDLNELRMEILRLRDGMTATGAEREVLEDLVAERDRHLAELDAEVQRLIAESQPQPRTPERPRGDAPRPPSYESDMTTPAGEFLGDAGPLPPSSPAVPVSFAVVVRTQGSRPHSLIEALASLTAQQHAPNQILVMVHHDDVDRMNAVATAITAFSPATAHHVREGGRSRPLNEALDLVASDYVCFLDDDDLAEPNWLSSFAAGIEEAPGRMIRARAGSQPWTTDGTNEPVRATGPITEPFAPSFDLLAHLSNNQTPPCSIAVPARVIEHFSLRFAEELPVLEDWDFLVRVAMHAGSHSIAERTSLWRRLDMGNSDTAETVATWEATHAAIIDRFAQRPVVLPTGDSRRLASAHFIPGGGSRHEAELAATKAELRAITKSPLRWGRAFAARARQALRARTAGRPR